MLLFVLMSCSCLLAAAQKALLELLCRQDPHLTSGRIDLRRVGYQDIDESQEVLGKEAAEEEEEEVLRSSLPTR